MPRLLLMPLMRSTPPFWMPVNDRSTRKRASVRVRVPLAWACLALAVTAAPCRGQGKRSVVEAWVTTADKSKLLTRAPNVNLVSGEPPGVATTIDVDTAITYQEMVGFGAAITDASAWLIQTKLSSTQREALLQDLFGRTVGIGLSFTRLTIGASDFSRTHYTFDDVPAGETDSALVHFSIGDSRSAVLPVVNGE